MVRARRLAVSPSSRGKSVPFALPGQTIITRGKRRVVIGSPAPTGPVADILLDFVNNIYRVDGTSYATAALAGWTGTGTFDANGYTAGSGQRIVNTIDLGANFIVVADFVDPATSANDRRLWSYSDGVTIAKTASATTIITLPSTATYTSPISTITFGFQGTSAKSSADGSAVTTTGGVASPGLVAFAIGNRAVASATTPWLSPIKKIAIYKQVLTDAQIRALT